MAMTVQSGSRKQSPVSPPAHWMINDEAIQARADELARQDGSESAEDQIQQAEAEYRAAAGSRRKPPHR